MLLDRLGNIVMSKNPNSVLIADESENKNELKCVSCEHTLDDHDEITAECKDPDCPCCRFVYVFLGELSDEQMNTLVTRN